MMSYLKLFLFGLALFAILEHTGSIQEFSRYRKYPDRRPARYPDKKYKRIPSDAICSEICAFVTSFNCSFFAYRDRGKKCLLYQKRENETDFANVEHFLKNVTGFDTFELVVERPPILNCIQEDDLYYRGYMYRGTISKTLSGKTCQRWDVNKEHPSIIIRSRPDYPSEHQNYCRNPSLDDGGPWCYTTDPETAWEYCDVPECSEISTNATTPAKLNE